MGNVFELRLWASLRSLIAAQDAEHPAQVGECGAGGLAERGELRDRACSELSGRRVGELAQTVRGCLGLHGDHRHVVRDDVVHFSRDPGPLLEDRTARFLVLGLCHLLSERVTRLASRGACIQRHRHNRHHDRR